jgi:putative transposase
VKPARKREAAQWLCSQFTIAARRSCRLLGIQRSSFYYQSHAKDQTALRIRLRDLAAARPRFGYRRLHVLLRREGWPVNHKRILPLYRLEEHFWETRFCNLVSKPP